MKDDNRGITLVEIIIIIALIGVLSGVFIGGMGLCLLYLMIKH